MVRPRFTVLLRPTLGALVAVGAAVAIGIVQPIEASWLLYARAGLVVVAAVWLGGRALGRTCRVFTVTTSRVIASEGVVVRRSREIPLARISDITVTAGPWQRLTRSGRLAVVAAGARLEVGDVPRPHALSALVWSALAGQGGRRTGLAPPEARDGRRSEWPGGRGECDTAGTPRAFARPEVSGLDSLSGRWDRGAFLVTQPLGGVPGPTGTVGPDRRRHLLQLYEEGVLTRAEFERLVADSPPDDLATGRLSSSGDGWRHRDPTAELPGTSGGDGGPASAAGPPR